MTTNEEHETPRDDTNAERPQQQPVFDETLLFGTFVFDDAAPDLFPSDDLFPADDLFPSDESESK